MLYLNVAIIVLLATIASYAITRPIGDRRRHVAATLLSLALATIGGFVTTDMVLSVIAALAGAFLGMMIAWRRRNPIGEAQTQTKKGRQSSRRPHYGISRA